MSGILVERRFGEELELSAGRGSHIVLRRSFKIGITWMGVFVRDACGLAKIFLLAFFSALHFLDRQMYTRSRYVPSTLQ